MTKVYHCVTGNWLCGSKRIFQSYKDCKSHIKKIIAMKEPWVSEEQAHSSIRVTMINTKELPEYKKIFKEFDGILPMERLENEGKRRNASKKTLNQKTESMDTDTPVPPKKTIIRHLKRVDKKDV